MTDDRASLGARIAEAMGGYRDEDGVWHIIFDAESWVTFVEPDSMVTWWGYGIVDAWMREQGYACIVRRDTYISVLYWDPRDEAAEGYATNHEGDEPLAAIQAAVAALEARE